MRTARGRRRPRRRRSRRGGHRRVERRSEAARSSSRPAGLSLSRSRGGDRRALDARGLLRSTRRSASCPTSPRYLGPTRSALPGAGRRSARRRKPSSPPGRTRRRAGLPRAPLMEVIPWSTTTSMAPPGHHVASIWRSGRPSDLPRGSWGDSPPGDGRADDRPLTEYAPNFRRAMDWMLLTPADIAGARRPDGRRSATRPRARVCPGRCESLPGWAHYRTPITGLYLCGAGTHPAARSRARRGTTPPTPS